MELSSRTDVESLEMLRGRVASFGLSIGGVLTVLWVLRVLASYFGRGLLRSPLEGGSLFHLAAGVLLLAAGALLSRFALSRRSVRIVEFVALVGGCGFLMAMGTSLPTPEITRPDLVLFLALTFVTCFRAVLVPSSVSWTAILSGLVGGLYLGTVAFIYAKVDVSVYGEACPKWAVDSHAIALEWTKDSLVWWCLSFGLAIATSRVIYGLQKEARFIRQLGQYRLQRKIGSGGMGFVYEAQHGMLRRPTAVKLLRPEKCGWADVERFELEVKQTARLRHTNTVTIYDYGRTSAGVFYYAMELLDGVTLEQLVAAEGPLPAARVGRILAQVAGALAEAHNLNLIHRDLKPANIMLCIQGGRPDIAKILDFGLVKQVSSEGATQAGSSLLTLASAVMGTPSYMAPESIMEPEAVDARTDIYALGAIGYFLLTGGDVFCAKTNAELFELHCHSSPEHPSERSGRELPELLSQLILRSLQKNPEDRPRDGQEFLSELLRCELPPWTDAQAQGWWASDKSVELRSQVEVESSDETIMLEMRQRT